MNVAVFQQSLMGGRRNLNFVEFTLVIKHFLLFPTPYLSRPLRLVLS